MDKKQRRHKSSKGSSASTKSTPMSSFVESVPGCTAVPFTTEKYPNYPNESFYMPESEAMYRNADSNVNAGGSHNFGTNFAAAPADNSNLIYSSECSSSQGTDSMHSVANTRASIPMGTYFSAASLAFDHSTAAERTTTNAITILGCIRLTWHREPSPKFRPRQWNIELSEPIQLVVSDAGTTQPCNIYSIWRRIVGLA